MYLLSVQSRQGKPMLFRSLNWSLLPVPIIVLLLVAMCAFPSEGIAQKNRGPLASAERLSEYVIQGTVNDERVELVLQHPANNDHSMLTEALREESAAWNALLERIQSWKPTHQDVQKQVPQRLANLVSVAHNSLLQSVSTIQKSPQYARLAARLDSSLAKVNTLQARLKRMLTPQSSETPASKAATPPNKR